MKKVNKYFDLQHDFDENGIIYFIGTNAGTCEWVNPGAHGLISVWSSDGRQLPYGRAEDVLSRSAEPLNVHTNDDRRAFIAMDLGLNVVPYAYTLRHARGYGRSALRNWLFQVCIVPVFVRILRVNYHFNSNLAELDVFRGWLHCPRKKIFKQLVALF